jgi:tRNA 2-thiouridine synthesizing protein A
LQAGTVKDVLDLRGLKCPLPALFARRALERAQPFETIEILADDPLAWIDIPHMCGQEGYAVIGVAREGNLVRIGMRRET